MAYLFNKNTPWLNNVVLGTDLTKSPEIATLVETKKMRKSVDTFIDTESRERKESHKTTQNLSQAVQMGFQNFSTNLSNDMQQTHYQLDNVNQGINSLSHSINDGLGSMKESIDKNSYIVEEGFYNVQNSIEENTFEIVQGMQNGFAGVIKSIFTTNHQLGQEIAVGFDNINQGQRQTTQAITTLDKHLVRGFNALQSDRLATSKILDRGFTKVQSTLAQGFANHQMTLLKEGELTRDTMRQEGNLTRETMVDVGNHIGQQINQSYEQIAHQQNEFKNALVDGFNQTFEQLSSIGMITSQLREDINYNFNVINKSLQSLGQDIRQQKRHFATESFRVGFRYMNAMMLESAKEQFDRALEEFGGHFPTLISYGYLSMLEDDSKSAKEWYGKAVIQAGHNGDERKERAVAQLHLARVYNSEDNLQEAIVHYKNAFANNPNVVSALIEELVCHFRLAQNDDEKYRVGMAIRDRLDGEDENSSNLWYFFALEIIEFDREIAINAMQQGISRDNLSIKNSADRIKDKLFQLNSAKYVDLMKELRKYGEFDWLF